MPLPRAQPPGGLRVVSGIAILAHGYEDAVKMVFVSQDFAKAVEAGLPEVDVASCEGFTLPTWSSNLTLFVGPLPMIVREPVLV